jgi:hypothetical protein
MLPVELPSRRSWRFPGGGGVEAVHDTIDRFGKLTLRHGSRLHHLGIGITHARTRVFILVAAHTVTLISKTGHHVLCSQHIDTNKNCWRNQHKNPGRRPGQSVTDDATQV